MTKLNYYLYVAVKQWCRQVRQVNNVVNLAFNMIYFSSSKIVLLEKWSISYYYIKVNKAVIFR